MKPAEPLAVAKPRWRSGAVQRWAAIGVSVAAHLGLGVALLLMAAPARPLEPPPVTVALVAALQPAPAAPKAPGPGPKAEVGALAPASLGRTTPMPAPPDLMTLNPGASPAIAPTAALTPAELAGAATADGSGPGGGGNGAGAGGGACNMLRRVQEALRRDTLVMAAARAPATAGKAVKVWDGDWLQSSGEDGKGLAAVREAIMWEVAFAPAACRAEPVHGLVLISLGGGPSATRLAMGGGDWRWSDLLGLAGGRAR
jgi:hypothetical protein